MPKVVTCILFRSTTSGTLITLSDFTLDEGESKTVTFPSVADIRQMILQRGRLHFDNKDSVMLDQHVCHFSVVTRAPCALIYACVAEPGFSSEQASIFLDALQGAVINDASLLPRLSTAGDYQLQQDVGPKFAYLMMEENRQDGQSARMSQLQQQVNEVKSVMSSNVQRILDRGDRLEDLEGRTVALSASSENFKISARRVQRHMCRRNAKWTIIIIVGTAVVVFIIVLIILNSLGVFGNK